MNVRNQRVAQRRLDKQFAELQAQISALTDLVFTLVESQQAAQLEAIDGLPVEGVIEMTVEDGEPAPDGSDETPADESQGEGEPQGESQPTSRRRR